MVDTTAAGDTFLGYFLATLEAGVPQALAMASCASSITVSRKGAAQSIPDKAEVLARLTSEHSALGLEILLN